MNITWFCLADSRTFAAPPGTAPTCYPCQRAGRKGSVVARCAVCRKLVAETEGKACLACAAEIRGKAQSMQRRSQPVTPETFVELWREAWGVETQDLAPYPAEIEKLCAETKPQHLRSAIHNARSIPEIERWCRDLAAGRNPGGGFDGGFRNYGSLRCPECGKMGGCPHRRDGGL